MVLFCVGDFAPLHADWSEPRGEWRKFDPKLHDTSFTALAPQPNLLSFRQVRRYETETKQDTARKGKRRESHTCYHAVVLSSGGEVVMVISGDSKAIGKVHGEKTQSGDLTSV